jgi:hypothetical protein
MHKKFHKVWFRHSEVDKGGFREIEARREQGDLTRLILVLKNKESRLKIY